jgi:hypothetical protein
MNKKNKKIKLPKPWVVTPQIIKDEKVLLVSKEKEENTETEEKSEYVRTPVVDSWEY